MIDFSNIFRLALDLLALVVNCNDFSRRVWDPGSRRDPNDWEVGKMMSSLGLLGNINLIPNDNDRWIWKLDRKESFNS